MLDEVDGIFLYDFCVCGAEIMITPRAHQNTVSTVATFNTFVPALAFLCGGKGHYCAVFSINLVILACLCDPFVYSGMTTGIEGAECFSFAPFNMQP